VETFKQKFAWLGQITGDTRDMDVYLLKFDAYKKRLPAPIREDLNPLHDFLIAHHKQAQKNLTKHLHSKPYRKIIQTWQQALKQLAKNKPTAKHAKQPTLTVANTRIWKVYQRILAEGNAIDDNSPAESLHDLRKTAKKLRYLMEFFQSLYPDKKITRLIKALKRLQDNLGDFQDYEVQAEKLQTFAMQMMQENPASAKTFMAMGVLTADLIKQQQQTRLVFAQRFDEFSRNKVQQAFAELFQPSDTSPAKKGSKK